MYYNCITEQPPGKTNGIQSHKPQLVAFPTAAGADREPQGPQVISPNIPGRPQEPQEPLILNHSLSGGSIHKLWRKEYFFPEIHLFACFGSLRVLRVLYHIA